MFKTNLAPLNL